MTKYRLPPKVLVVHRFTHDMLTDDKQIELDPRVQIVINMDGWGRRGSSSTSYARCEIAEPVQFTGFKLFYHNDTKNGDSAVRRARCSRYAPADLHPVPIARRAAPDQRCLNSWYRLIKPPTASEVVP